MQRAKKILNAANWANCQWTKYEDKRAAFIGVNASKKTKLCSRAGIANTLVRDPIGLIG